jgi:hypothetical protein
MCGQLVSLHASQSRSEDAEPEVMRPRNGRRMRVPCNQARIQADPMALCPECGFADAFHPGGSLETMGQTLIERALMTLRLKRRVDDSAADPPPREARRARGGSAAPEPEEHARLVSDYREVAPVDAHEAKHGFQWNGAEWQTTVVVDHWNHKAFVVTGMSRSRPLDLTPYHLRNPDCVQVVLRRDGAPHGDQAHPDTRVILERRPDLVTASTLAAPGHWAQPGQSDFAASRPLASAAAAADVEALPWGYVTVHEAYVDVERDRLALTPEAFEALQWVQWRKARTLLTTSPASPPVCVVCDAELSGEMLALDCSTTRYLHALCRTCAAHALCPPNGSARCPRCHTCVSVRETGIYPLVARRLAGAGSGAAAAARDFAVALPSEASSDTEVDADQPLARDKECSACRTLNTRRSVACSNCDYSFPGKSWTCVCGHRNDLGASTCLACTRPVPTAASAAAPTSWLCSRCGLRNRLPSEACVACWAPRQG